MERRVGTPVVGGAKCPRCRGWLTEQKGGERDCLNTNMCLTCGWVGYQALPVKPSPAEVTVKEIAKYGGVHLSQVGKNVEVSIHIFRNRTFRREEYTCACPFCDGEMQTNGKVKDTWRMVCEYKHSIHLMVDTEDYTWE